MNHKKLVNSVIDLSDWDAIGAISWDQLDEVIGVETRLRVAELGDWHDMVEALDHLDLLKLQTYLVVRRLTK